MPFCTVEVEMLAIEPGNRVLDVGCGTGEDAAAMSTVASDVFAVGLDLSSRNVIEAQQRHGRTGVAFVIADGRALPIRNGCLDRCRTGRTLQHIADAGLVVVEIGRTLRPGGRVVFSEPDWPSCVLAGGSESASELVLRHWIRGRNSNPRVGRNLPGLLVDAGLEPVGLRSDAIIYRSLDEVEDAGAFPLRRAAEQAAVDGVIERRTADTWIADLAAASRRGRFVFSVPLFTVVGVKPPGP
jgi:SAM-dependent methyltransferase